MENEKHSWDKVNQWAEELDLLHTILAKTELVETVKWGGPTFTVNGKNVLATGGFKNYFTVWFHNGVFLKDQYKVLVNANEGVTKGLRQWRFYSKDDIDEKRILEYVNEAIENEKAGLKIKPEKTKVAEIPEILKLALAKNKLSETFSALSPYKQKEFVEYIGTAKREETKVLRLEKIIPMIQSGIGLNDKYK